MKMNFLKWDFILLLILIAMPCFAVHPKKLRSNLPRRNRYNSQPSSPKMDLLVEAADIVEEQSSNGKSSTQRDPSRISHSNSFQEQEQDKVSNKRKRGSDLENAFKRLAYVSSKSGGFAETDSDLNMIKKRAMLAALRKQRSSQTNPNREYIPRPIPFISGTFKSPTIIDSNSDSE